MRNHRWTKLLSLTVLSGSLVVLPAQQTNSANSPQTNRPADNTKNNQADRVAGQPTADQAKNDRSDRELMKQIRRDILKDKSLSTYAHNVKVIADHGKVTLRGPVKTDEERSNIEAKAAAVAGAGNVTNDITVKSETASK